MRKHNKDIKDTKNYLLEQENKSNLIKKENKSNQNQLYISDLKYRLNQLKKRLKKLQQ